MSAHVMAQLRAWRWSARSTGLRTRQPPAGTGLRGITGPPPSASVLSLPFSLGRPSPDQPDSQEARAVVRPPPVIRPASPVSDHLRACLYRARQEMITVHQNERRHKHALSAHELFFRGEAVFDLHVDPHYHAFTYEGRIVLRLVRASHWEPARIRSGNLMRLVWNDPPDSPPDASSGASSSLESSPEAAVFRHPDVDNRFPAWKSVSVVVSHIENQHIYVQVESLDNFLTQALRTSETGQSNSAFRRLPVYLIRRSELGIYALQIQSLSRLRSHPTIRAQWHEPLFPKLVQDTGSPISTHPSHFFHPHLDAAKKRAVLECDRRPHLGVIHGPPGTGKTTTLAAAILSAVANGDKVLVVAPSHTACDAITLALLKHWPESQWGSSDQGALVRIGMDLRVTVRALTRYLAVNLRSDESFQAVVKDLAHVRGNILACPQGQKGQGPLLAREKALVKERNRLFHQLQDAAIHQAQIVVATNLSALKHSIFSLVLKGEFNLVCMDEAGFVPDEIVLPFLTSSTRLILSGDHMQLPPIYYSLDATKKGPAQSLFERLIIFAPENVSFLDTQYRSNSLIAQWSSQTFYNGQVLSHASVADQLLQDLPHVKASTETSTPLLFIDTSGQKDGHETNLAECVQDDENSSILNRKEGSLVEQLVRKYLSLSVNPCDIGIITPYWNQVMLLRSLIWTDERRQAIEIRTVDGYQGREKELIIMSFVRSNPEHDIGFLRESRRVNVSITRAKRACILVGDASTLRSDPTLANFISFCEHNDALLPVRDIL